MEHTAAETDRAARRRWVWLGLVALLVGVALWLRVDRGHQVVVGEQVVFRDNDTVRRLERLEHLVDPQTEYPYRNPRDGAPAGTVIHWTLPMDWVILALDPLVSWAYPQAARFEAGAIWADALLGTLSVLVFALLSARWLGSWVGLLATALYAFSFPAVHTSRYGIGDHQSLQHLCLVVALLGFCCLLWNKAGRRLPLLVGAGLGLAMWVSTESSIALYAMSAGAFAHLLLLEPDRRRAAARLHLQWIGAALAVALVGDRFEHPGRLLTFEWDQVSGFWLYQMLVFAGFLAALLWLPWLARLPGRWTGPLVAAAISVAAALGLLFATGLDAAVREQLELFRGANRWTQNTVDEYRALVVAFDTFQPLLAQQQLNWLIFGLPLWIAGAALSRGAGPARRLPVLLMTVGLFGFTAMEMKVSHLFVLLYPWLLITGGSWCLARFCAWLEIGALAQRIAGGVLGAGAVAMLFTGLPPAQAGEHVSQRDTRELTAAVRRLQDEAGDERMRSVLAHWHWGAKLMYYGQAPVVASGYHRNLSGIEDSYRVMLSSGFQECEPILRARRVRWILTQADTAFLAEGHEVVPSLPRYVDIYDPRVGARGVAYNYRVRGAAKDTLHTRLTSWRPGLEPLPHFELVFESSLRTPARGHDGVLFQQPRYRIWRVVYPEER